MNVMRRDIPGLPGHLFLVQSLQEFHDREAQFLHALGRSYFSRQGLFSELQGFHVLSLHSACSHVLSHVIGVAPFL